MKDYLLHQRKIIALLIIASSILFYDQAYTQSDSLKSLKYNIELCGGMSIPMGDHASTIAMPSGFPLTGFDVGAKCNAEVAKNFQIGILGTYNMNPYNRGAIPAEFRSTSPDDKVFTSSWESIWLMGTIGFVVDASANTKIHGEGIGGLLFSTYPHITFVGSAYEAINTSTPIAFGYGISGGVLSSTKYDITVQFLTGKPEYEYTSIVEFGCMKYSSSGTFKQITSVIEVNFGYIIN